MSDFQQDCVGVIQVKKLSVCYFYNSSMKQPLDVYNVEIKKKVFLNFLI